MEKFVPYEKLSKKEKRKMDLAKRQTWGELNLCRQKAREQQGLQQKQSPELEA